MQNLSGKGRSERRKWHFRASRFKNFPLDPPNCARPNHCTLQEKCWIAPVDYGCILPKLTRSFWIFSINKALCT